MDLLNVENLYVHFHSEDGVARAVDGVSFRIRKGETHSLVGESGCGKSATALAVMRLLAPQSLARFSGNIQFNDINLLSLDTEEMRSFRGSAISMIFQEPMTALNPVEKVGPQIREAIAVHNKQHLSFDKIHKRVLDLMDETGLKEVDRLYHKYPHELSGGMRQRIVIAMALANEPELIIADEPTTALDVTTQAQILTLMNELQKNRGSSILLITHDLGVVSRMAHTMSVMYAGQVVEEGNAADVFSDPCHPYTQALFAALPSHNLEARGKLNAIPGQVPPASKYDQLTSPCRYFERCQFRDERCFKKSNAPGHHSYCGREGK